MNSSTLPTLRRKIFRSFSFIVLLYAVLGALLVLSVFLASGTTPKLIHVNYDSIAAAQQMKEAWDALSDPPRHSRKSDEEWRARFENALAFEEGNISEPGEAEPTHAVRELWTKTKGAMGDLSKADFQEMHRQLDSIVQVNEKGMFSFVQKNNRLSRFVLFGALGYFFISLLLAIFFADSLAERLSRPLKSLAEVLRSPPQFGRRLRLPDANSLEVMILNNELASLWQKVSNSEKINIGEIVKQKSKLETVLESVEDALLVVDASNRVTHCNSCLLSLIKLPAREVIGHVWTDLPTNDENYLKLRSVLNEDMPEASESELTLDQRKGFYAARSRNIMDESKNLIARLYLLHDITEKRQREKFRTEFIDLLSHELKTPLQSLGTASGLLMRNREKFPEDLQFLIDTIAEDIERLRAVSSEFVQITQSHAKVLKLKLERVALNELLPEWIKPFKVTAKDKKVSIEFQSQGSGVIYANIDRVKFPWTISNLLSNALRYAPEGSVVRVYLNNERADVEIVVTDEGPGIAAEERFKVFEPFFQSKANELNQRGMFGVGLTIAREVVEVHDGRIEYSSREPHGSMFRILLPKPGADKHG